MDIESLVIRISATADGVSGVVADVRKAVDQLRTFSGAVAGAGQALLQLPRARLDADSRPALNAIGAVTGAGRALTRLPQARLDADNRPALSAIDGIVGAWKSFLALAASAAGAISPSGASTSSTARRSGGGGGGGSRSNDAEDAARAAEEARRAQEEAWQRELDAQLRVVEHKKRLGEITTQQEIAQLERIERKYVHTTEQKLEMEEKLFDARARLREEEIADIDRLNSGILSALRARYEQQREIERARLNESAASWRDWSDASVQAVQAQIDALDALEIRENREDQGAEKLRKIEATRQMLTYTTDEANAARLQKELERLEADYAAWQRKNAVSDEKQRLRAEQDTIRDYAKTEQNAVAAQREALDAGYAQRLQEASLRAEAERMLTTANQNEILTLIGQYAPAYEATGKSLGERLYAGMTGALGNLADWFRGFTQRFESMGSAMAATALASADEFYRARQGAQGVGASQSAPVTVEQNNNFYVPVESPAEVARRIEQVNEQLALRLA